MASSPELCKNSWYSCLLRSTPCLVILSSSCTQWCNTVHGRQIHLSAAGVRSADRERLCTSGAPRRRHGAARKPQRATAHCDVRDRQNNWCGMHSTGEGCRSAFVGHLENLTRQGLIKATCILSCSERQVKHRS